MTSAVQGQVDARFDKLADALADELAGGAELGAAIAIDVDGEYVVDIWGGHADAARTIPWTEPSRRITAAYVMKKMGQGALGNERTARYVKLIYEAIS